jgi:choline dehydrogenase-like flavoprotein
MLDDYKAHNEGLGLNSAHPQGGNPISTDASTGVVDEEFRVHGMDNVYVCDASVFPSSVTVNPQLTVMALADYASQGIV